MEFLNASMSTDKPFNYFPLIITERYYRYYSRRRTNGEMYAVDRTSKHWQKDGGVVRWWGNLLAMLLLIIL